MWKTLRQFVNQAHDHNTSAGRLNQVSKGDLEAIRRDPLEYSSQLSRQKIVKAIVNDDDIFRQFKAALREKKVHTHAAVHSVLENQLLETAETCIVNAEKSALNLGNLPARSSQTTTKFIKTSHQRRSFRPNGVSNGPSLLKNVDASSLFISIRNFDLRKDMYSTRDTPISKVPSRTSLRDQYRKCNHKNKSFKATQLDRRSWHEVRERHGRGRSASQINALERFHSDQNAQNLSWTEDEAKFTGDEMARAPSPRMRSNILLTILNKRRSKVVQ